MFIPINSTNNLFHFLICYDSLCDDSFLGYKLSKIKSMRLTLIYNRPVKLNSLDNQHQLEQLKSFYVMSVLTAKTPKTIYCSLSDSNDYVSNEAKLKKSAPVDVFVMLGQTTAISKLSDINALLIKLASFISYTNLANQFFLGKEKSVIVTKRFPLAQFSDLQSLKEEFEALNVNLDDYILSMTITFKEDKVKKSK